MGGLLPELPFETDTGLKCYKTGRYLSAFRDTLWENVLFRGNCLYVCATFSEGFAPL